jgi:hypothetical protein
VCTALIIAEIHHAVNKRGGSARPATPDEAQRVLRDLGADIDLRSIVDSWQDALPDEDILQLLGNWNAGRPLFGPSTPLGPRTTISRGALAFVSR